MSLLWKKIFKILSILYRIWTLLALEEMPSVSSSNYEWEIILFVPLITESYYCPISENIFLLYFLWISNFLIWKANLVIVILSRLEVGFPSLYLGEELSSLLKGKSVSPTSELMYYGMWKSKALVHGGMQRFFHNQA